MIIDMLSTPTTLHTAFQSRESMYSRRSVSISSKSIDFDGLSTYGCCCPGDHCRWSIDTRLFHSSRAHWTSTSYRQPVSYRQLRSMTSMRPAVPWPSTPMFVYIQLPIDRIWRSTTYLFDILESQNFNFLFTELSRTYRQLLMNAHCLFKT